MDYKKILELLDNVVIPIKDENECKIVLQKLFSLGFEWEHSGTKLLHLDAKYLTTRVSYKKIINYGILEIDELIDEKLINVEQLLKL